MMPALLRERRLSGRDAGLATELAYGTLRGLGTYDEIIAACSDRAPEKVDPPLLDAIRLGVHQLLKTRVPPHAAVGTTVDLVRLRVGVGASKYANAVLRKVSTRSLEQWLPIVAPDPAEDPIGHLAVAHSHPRWIVTALRDAVGGDFDETAALLAADNERPRVTLVARPGRSSVEELLASGAEAAQYSPYAAYLPEGDPGAVPAVAESRAAVQDEASQLVALALTRVPVEGTDSRWLDLCAGPGGKAGLLDAIATHGTSPAARRCAPPGSRAGHPARWPSPAEPTSSPPSFSTTAPAWSGRPPATPRWSPSTARLPPGGRGRSTGSWSTPPAPAWAPCAAGRRPAGAATPAASPNSAGSSVTCSPRPSTPSVPAGSSPTRPARLTWPRRPPWSVTSCAAATTSRPSTPGPTFPRWTGWARALTPSSGPTATAPTGCSWRCCAAAERLSGLTLARPVREDRA